jgi:hypothetical protein
VRGRYIRIDVVTHARVGTQAKLGSICSMGACVVSVTLGQCCLEKRKVVGAPSERPHENELLEVAVVKVNMFCMDLAE